MLKNPVAAGVFIWLFRISESLFQFRRILLGKRGTVEKGPRVAKRIVFSQKTVKVSEK